MNHPAGRIGRRLILRVADVMLSNGDVPIVSADTLVADALSELSSKGCAGRWCCGGWCTVWRCDGRPGRAMGGPTSALPPAAPLPWTAVRDQGLRPRAPVATDIPGAGVSRTGT